MWLWRGETGPVGTRPGDAAELPRQPARRRLRPRRTPRAATRSARRRGQRRRAAALRQELDRHETALPAAGAGRRASSRSRSRARRRSSPTASSRTPSDEPLRRRAARQRRLGLARRRRSGAADRAGRAGGGRRGCPTAARRSRPRRAGRAARVRARSARRALAGDARRRCPGRRRVARAVPRRRRAAGGRLAAAAPATAADRTAAGARRPPGFAADPLSPAGGAGKRRACCARPRAAGATRGTNSNTGQDPPGGYSSQDLPYRPDPIIAVLVDPSGVAGLGRRAANVEHAERSALQTRPTSSATRPTASRRRPTAPVADRERGQRRHDATFAIGGDAECAAPCAERVARAASGPQRVARHGRVARGARSARAAFLYTGPRVTEGGSRATAHPIPFAAELGRTAQTPRRRSAPMPPYAVPARTISTQRPEREGTEHSVRGVALRRRSRSRR